MKYCPDWFSNMAGVSCENFFNYFFKKYFQFALFATEQKTRAACLINYVNRLSNNYQPTLKKIYPKPFPVFQMAIVSPSFDGGVNS